MDRFFDRLGDVIKDFLNDDDARVFGKGRPGKAPFSDPDLDAAYDELDDFLNGGKKKHSTSWADAEEKPNPKKANNIPSTLVRDFSELGLSTSATQEDCKAAYKKLLKIHHPDRHAGHPGNMAKATEKSSRINASYQRLELWFETGKVESGF
ncbi:hypothetical protein MASR2M78_32400 [Treponema sp.]